MNDIVYRKWAYEDIIAVAALEKKCFSDPWSFSMLADTFFNENAITVAAEQGGKLIGAVTHVFLNDPTRGYGISIANMLGK